MPSYMLNHKCFQPKICLLFIWSKIFHLPWKRLLWQPFLQTSLKALQRALQKVLHWACQCHKYYKLINISLNRALSIVVIQYKMELYASKLSLHHRKTKSKKDIFQNIFLPYWKGYTCCFFDICYIQVENILYCSCLSQICSLKVNLN